MVELTARTGKLTGFGLVRDQYGNPKVDDIFNCPKEILSMMTEDEINKLRKEQSK